MKHEIKVSSSAELVLNKSKHTVHSYMIEIAPVLARSVASSGFGKKNKKIFILLRIMRFHNGNAFAKQKYIVLTTYKLMLIKI